MLLAEDLVLLALDPERGIETHSSGPYVAAAVPGALLLELALDGLVTFDGTRFVGTGLTTTDPLLAETVPATAHGKRARNQLHDIDRALQGARHRVVDRLVDAEVIGRVRKGSLSSTTHPVLRRDLRDELVGRLQEAAAGDGEIEPRTALVLALSGPLRLLEVVAPLPPRKHARRRIDHALEHVTLDPGVRTAVEAALKATLKHVYDATTSSS